MNGLADCNTGVCVKRANAFYPGLFMDYEGPKARL